MPPNRAHPLTTGGTPPHQDRALSGVESCLKILPLSANISMPYGRLSYSTLVLAAGG